jgi:uncharacterized phage protein (TIGR02220 family)
VTIQTAFRLKKTLVDKLKKYCETEGRSQTWVANKAFSDYLGLTQKEPTGIVSVSQKKPVASKAVAVVVDDTADKVIDYLNSQAGTRYKHTDTNRKLINARLKEYTKREVFDVITKKCAEWKGSEMERYLRPSTLFNATKFDEYLNQKVIDKPATGRNTPSLDSTRTRDKTVQQQLADKSWAG